MSEHFWVDHFHTSIKNAFETHGREMPKIANPEEMREMFVSLKMIFGFGNNNAHTEFQTIIRTELLAVFQAELFGSTSAAYYKKLEIMDPNDAQKLHDKITAQAEKNFAPIDSMINWDIFTTTTTEKTLTFAEVVKAQMKEELTDPFPDMRFELAVPTLTKMNAEIGKYFSNAWVQKNILNHEGENPYDNNDEEWGFYGVED